MNDKSIVHRRLFNIKGKFTVLFLALVAGFLAYPFVIDQFRNLRAGDLLSDLVLFAGVYAVSKTKWQWIFALFLAGINLIATGATYYTHFHPVLMGFDHEQFILFGIMLKGVFFGFTAVSILISIMTESRITTDTLFGSFCVFFLLALVWAAIFGVLNFFNPNSFHFEIPPQPLYPNEADANVKLGYFVYYSFSTLTTLGLGDITPVSLPARFISVLEAAVGQLYLAVLVARLVGMHLSSQRNT